MSAVAVVVFALVLGGGVVACGSGDGNGTGAAVEDDPGVITSHPRNGNVVVTVGFKDSTEQRVLGEIYAQALEAAGYRVKRHIFPAGADAEQAVKSGQVSGYPEYLGELLISRGVKPENVPADEIEAYEKAKDSLAEAGLTVFPPTLFARDYVVGTLRGTAEERNLRTLSDLEGKAHEMTLSGSPQCRARIDCLAALEKHYRLRFESFIPVEADRSYVVLDTGQADLSILVSTDARLAAEEERYVTLEDSEEALPAGNVAWVTTNAAAEESGPDYETRIIQVQQNLQLPVMQELKAKVELDGESPREVAARYLDEFNYVG